jgi:hypothetical protein
MQPDHDRLPAHVRDAVDETLRARAAEQPDVWSAPARSGSGCGAVLVALGMAVLAAALLVLVALFVDAASHEPMPGRPAPGRFVSTTPFPCPSGGPWC